MTHTKQTPAWTRIAAATMVAQHLVVFLVHPITMLGAASLGVTVLLALFLLRGSRVAWVLAVLSAAALLISPLTLDQPAWFAGAAAVIIACLLVRASRAFVWAERQRGASSPLRSAAMRLRERVLALAYGLIARVPGLDGGPADKVEAGDRPSHAKLIALLAVCIVILYPLVGQLYDFHHGSGSNSVLVDVLWRVVWIGFGFAQLTLIFLVVAAAYRYFTKPKGYAQKT